VLQAAASALLSVGLAVPVARALARRRFPGRGLLISLMGAPFLLPVIVAVLGLLAVFGRQGVLNGALQALGLPAVSVYGFHGVVLAHVFFNLPLAVRMILSGWQDIPAERFRLAAALGLGAGPVFRHLEWPMLRAILPGALVAVFLICLTSFAVALMLALALVLVPPFGITGLAMAYAAGYGVRIVQGWWLARRILLEKP
jgi:thiamine transport system permease protein